VQLVDVEPGAGGDVTVHAFVDETKKGGLLLVAAVVASQDREAGRAVMRQLRRPGQSRVHFSKERRGRQGAIAAAICRTNVVVDLYDASAFADEREARAACLRQLVEDLTAAGVEKLFIAQDDSLVASDKAVLFDAIRKTGTDQPLRYLHLRPREEPLLWIADAAAWCWTHGPSWRRRIQPVVRNVWRP
jgi:hypothetical protein